jgi:hypothetical protein
VQVSCMFEACLARDLVRALRGVCPFVAILITRAMANRAEPV